MQTKIDIYIPGEVEPATKALLCENVKDVDRGQYYADMLRKRSAGELAAVCTDIYYIATQEGAFVSRLWNGWGKHRDAIGNFGNFQTNAELRGQGIGRQMLEVWREHVRAREDAPLALFCNAGAEHLVKLYAPYGFRLAVDGTTVGPLYCPLGSSPATFREFCADYYGEKQTMTEKPATVEYRHEIDCLLRFALLNEGENLGLPGVGSMEEAYLKGLLDDMLLYFNEKDHVVGWGIRTADGVCRQLYPTYR
ncbi:MAG: GNAT family N-acetyltransferase [Clostridia bacterium]|nr:GNAT family N-acetyltransferase [Clostridia bacterium]